MYRMPRATKGMAVILLALLCSSCDDEDEQQLPIRAFVWGDSIRYRYMLHAPEVAGDTIEWTQPTFWYGMTSEDFLTRLRNIDDLAYYDVFHLNTGIHDQWGQVPLETYKAIWRDIIAEIRQQSPRVPIILATSTQTGGDNTLLVQYNDFFREIADPRDRIYVNDMEQLQLDGELELLPDGIHFTEESTIRMAQEVMFAVMRFG